MLLCDRCYGRLRRRLEQAPDVVAHLRSIADPLKAAVYDRVIVQGSAPAGSPAPVASDVLDAVADIMHTIHADDLTAGTASDAAYVRALGAVGYLLDNYDELANNAEGVLEWWRLVMSMELPERPEFWTITRALARWPLEERRRWAQQPCPECGLRSVKITPPRHKHARTWFECQKCGWKKTELDDDGLWAAAFGQYAEDRSAEDERGNIMAETETKTHDIDMADAIKAGIRYTLEHAEQVEKAGPAGVPTAAIIGAVPWIAAQFAQIAEAVAQEVRHNYKNGDLLAGGARLVAKAILEAGGGATLGTADEKAAA